ncbi:MAG: PBP1A family penicillin-binding protein [Calditerrivibrio sp.]|nr:PBP1A family penicillin-binding protein [Calditerrivibrio sp.]
MKDFILKYKKWIFIYMGVTILLGILTIGYLFFIVSDLPSVEQLKNFKYKVPTYVYDINGKQIAELGIEKRVPVKFDQIPKHLVNALVSVEDSRFFSHGGLDFFGIFRAVFSNIKAGKVVEGGSTITQQLVKVIYLTPERKFTRKFKEAVLAYKIDKYLSKEEVLEIYFNQVYFGKGSYGVESASMNYFGKHVWELNLYECAVLAGIPKAPGIYAPTANVEKSIARTKHVLSRMFDEGYINKDELNNFSFPNVIVSSNIPIRKNYAGYFVDYIIGQLKSELKIDDFNDMGYKIFTTLDLDMQLKAEEAVRNGVLAVSKRQGYFGVLGKNVEPNISEKLKKISYLEEFNIFPVIAKGVTQTDVTFSFDGKNYSIKLSENRWAYPNGTKQYQLDDFRKIINVGDYFLVQKTDSGFILSQEPKVEGSLLAIDPQTGAIVSMVGGFDYRKSYFNRAYQSKRQVGSLFKPFVYTAAIDSGYNSTTMVYDAPIMLEGAESGKYWSPQNFDRQYYGFTTVKDALTTSKNVVSVKIAEKIGIKKIKDFAINRFGITSDLANDLSISIGSASISLMEMVYAYSLFPNMGKNIKPYPIVKVLDDKGNVVYEKKPSEGEQVIRSSVIHIMNEMLTNVVEDGTAQSAKSIPRLVAGKTGTTNDYKDAWFIGYTPDIVVGTWVGFDEFITIGRGETGGRAALPIWVEYMKKVLDKVPNNIFPSSPDVVYYKVDVSTNKKIEDITDDYKFEPFIEEPKENDVIN